MLSSCHKAVVPPLFCMNCLFNEPIDSVMDIKIKVLVIVYEIAL